MSIYKFQKEYFNSSKKKRLFAEPRYISEICTADMSTPKRTKRIISFVKKENDKKHTQTN